MPAVTVSEPVSGGGAASGLVTQGLPADHLGTQASLRLAPAVGA